MELYALGIDLDKTVFHLAGLASTTNSNNYFVGTSSTRLLIKVSGVRGLPIASIDVTHIIFNINDERVSVQSRATSGTGNPEQNENN